MENNLTERALRFNSILISNEEHLKNIQNYGGISVKEVTDYNLGWNEESQRYTIPIGDGNGGLADIIEKDINSIDEWIEDIGKAYQKVLFERSINSSYYGKAITFNGIVIGKDLSPYLIPRAIEITCVDMGNKKKCPYCAITERCISSGKLIDNGFAHIFRCQQDRDVILNFINTTDRSVESHIRRYFKIPDYHSCHHVKLKVIDKQNVEEIMISAELDYDKIDTEYIVQRSFIFSDDIKTNSQYQFYGTTWNDPNTQRSTHIINRVKSNLDPISKWKLTPEMKKQLTIFQPKIKNDVGSIAEKIKEIYTDLSHNVTRIKKRENVILAFDLVYHSVLQFNFLGNRLTKGWMECLVGGDTRTGKTETIRSLVRHYKAGEFLTSGENVTLAGILGGVQQTHGNSRWSLTWGKIPINDRGALVIDESENIVKAEIMGYLSGVRSSGIAELHKIQSRRTLARTRLIFVANPIHGDVKDYNFGVDIVKELMGHQQDVARLDFAVLVTKNDISLKEINERETRKFNHIFTSELCHNRIMFAWSRTPDQVRITKEAEDTILFASNLLGKKYSSDIPLIIGAEIRIKLARMATSIATMIYNVDETGEIVIVERAHVIFAVNFLESQYHGKTMGYFDYSQQKRMIKRLRHLPALEGKINTSEKINLLLIAKRIQPSDIEDIFCLDRPEAREIISLLRKSGAVKNINYFHVKTPPFIDWLKERRTTITGPGADPEDFDFEEEE